MSLTRPFGELLGDIPTVADMKLKDGRLGEIFSTAGYYTAGDGGAARYMVVAAQAADGYGDHALANGRVAVLLQEGNVSASSYGMIGTATDDTAALNALVAAYPAEEITVEFKGNRTYNLSSDVSIPSNILLSVSKGSLLSLAAGTTLTINGGLEAGWYQIFAGSGDVSFGKNTISRGKVLWSGKSDLGDKINQMWGWGIYRLELPIGQNSYSTGIVVPQDNFQYSLFGQGHDATVLNFTGTGIALSCEAASASNRAFAVFRDFALNGTSSALHGIAIDLGTRKTALERVSITGFTGASSVGLFVRSNIGGNGGTNIMTCTDAFVTLCNTGVKLTNINIITFTGGVIEDCEAACLEVVDCKGVSFFSTVIQSANTGANMVRISAATRDCVGPNFFGCWFEEHIAQTTVKIEDTATYKITGVLFSGCEITNNTSSTSGTYTVYVAGSGTAANISLVSCKVRATNADTGAGTGVYLAGAATRAWVKEVEYQADVNTGGSGVFV